MLCKLSSTVMKRTSVRSSNMLLEMQDLSTQVRILIFFFGGGGAIVDISECHHIILTTRGR